MTPNKTIEKPNSVKKYKFIMFFSKNYLAQYFIYCDI